MPRKELPETPTYTLVLPLSQAHLLANLVGVAGLAGTASSFDELMESMFRGQETFRDSPHHVVRALLDQTTALRKWVDEEAEKAGVKLGAGDEWRETVGVAQSGVSAESEEDEEGVQVHGLVVGPTVGTA